MFSTCYTKYEAILIGLGYSENEYPFNIEMLPNSIANMSYFIEAVNIGVDTYLSSNTSINNLFISINVGYEIFSVTQYKAAVDSFEILFTEFLKAVSVPTGAIKQDIVDAPLKYFNEPGEWLIGQIILKVVI